ncbi:MAG: hypothetical protein KTR13_04110 [Saprospiraceae bacterium]|nr:hypothetical protein [Saprospiraceae bacterium]
MDPVLKTPTYQVILFILGSLLFLTLLVLLIIAFSRKQKTTNILLGFAIPIIMIGFPGIEYVKIGKSGGELKTLIQEVEANPTTENKAELEDAVAKVKEKQLTASGWIAVNKANVLIGDEDAVIEADESLMNKLKTEAQVQEYKSIQKAAVLQKEIKQSNPQTFEDSLQLKMAVQELEQLPLTDQQFKRAVVTNSKNAVSTAK